MGNILDKLKGSTIKKKLLFREKPPKLTPEGIRSLLEQSLKLSKRNPKIFSRLLVVSNNFLSISRLYPVYTLVVDPGTAGIFYITFKREINLSDFEGICNLDGADHFISHSYDSTFKLTKLLEPKYFYLNLVPFCVPNEVLEQYEALFGLVRNGEVGLRLSAWNTSLALNRLAPYLKILECRFKELVNADLVSTLNLNYLMIFLTLDNEKFKTLLRHNIQNITVDRFRVVDGVAIMKLEELRVNSMLQTLKIDDFFGAYESLGRFFNFLKHHCPYLRSLQLSFDFRDDTLCPRNAVISTDEVLKNLPKIHEKLKALRDHEMSSSLSSLVIRAKSQFRVSKNSFERNWPEKLKHHEGFKEIIAKNDDPTYVEFKSEYGLFTLMHLTGMHRRG